jgi:hypothetical protein
MAVGYDREQNAVNSGDSVELYAYLYDREGSPVDPDTLVSVEYTIQKPDDTMVTADGELMDDGAGFLRYTDTELRGEYAAVAKFTFTDGGIKSTRTDFEVIDPFRDTFDPEDPDYDQLAHYKTIVSDRVWAKITDLFDSQDGGPWMMDMTLNVFSPVRIQDFIDEALFDINVYNPPTDFTIVKFTQPVPIALNGPMGPNPNLTVLVQGVLIAVIRHLMRTYVEQPTPAGGQVTYEDRRDYLQRWGTIYQIEFQHYDHLVKMWKRQFLHLHESKNLVANKAGRLMPAPLRSRNIGRGYW